MPDLAHEHAARADLHQVYAAESMPSYNRDIGKYFADKRTCVLFRRTFVGMGIATALNWILNFFVAVTWPLFENRFHRQGAFAWYAAWCVVGEIVILL